MSDCYNWPWYVDVYTYVHVYCCTYSGIYVHVHVLVSKLGGTAFLKRGGTGFMLGGYKLGGGGGWGLLFMLVGAL